MELAIVLLLSLYLAWPISAQLARTHCRPNTGPGAANLTCGALATAPKDTLYLQPQHVSDVDECRDYCERKAIPLSNQHCTHYGFDSTTNICQLYDFRYRFDKLVLNSSSSIEFWNRKCFKCRLCPKGVYGRQLLDNGGFEASTDLIGPWDALHHNQLQHMSIISPGRHSNNALQYTPGGKLPGIFQPFNQCNDSQIYLFTFDYKIDAADGQVASIDSSPAFKPSGSLSYSFRLPTSSLTRKWNHVQALIAPGFYGELDIAMFPHKDSSSNLSYIVDNIHLSAISTTEPVPGAHNAFRNGGFDDGNLAPWKVTKSPNSTASVHYRGLHGTPHAFRFFSKQEPTYCLLQQELKTTPGAIYSVSFKYNFPDDIIQPVAMIWGDWGTKYPSKNPFKPKYYDASVQVCATDSVGICQAFFVARAPRTLFGIQVQHTNPDSYGTFFFDNFTAYKV